MAFGRRSPAESPADQNIGNIYERLNLARRKRERILDTPSPANDDREASRIMSRTRTFPTLKPPRADMPDIGVEKGLAWTVPWLIGATIFAVIFGFAVG